MDYRELFDCAISAGEKAYAPYSHYKVGAALLTKSGKVFTGCNIENASFSATNCAERTAVFKAVSEGETEFYAIAVAGRMTDKPLEFCPPCGVCRQVLAEFNNKDFKIILGDGEDIKMYTLDEILPMSFNAENLG